MSSAMKPRKSAPLPGWAPWPRITITGPWLAGSLFGFDESNALPAFGSIRRDVSVSVPRQAVLAVAKKSRNWVSLVAHGYVLLDVAGPGAFTYRRTAIGS